MTILLRSWVQMRLPKNENLIILLKILSFRLFQKRQIICSESFLLNPNGANAGSALLQAFIRLNDS